MSQHQRVIHYVCPQQNATGSSLTPSIHSIYYTFREENKSLAGSVSQPFQNLNFPWDGGGAAPASRQTCPGGLAPSRTVRAPWPLATRAPRQTWTNHTTSQRFAPQVVSGKSPRYVSCRGISGQNMAVVPQEHARFGSPRPNSNAAGSSKHLAPAYEARR